MGEVQVRIERKRGDEGHWIRPSGSTGNSEQQYRVLHAGKELGVWRDPECSAARELLARGLAQRDDVLVSYRGETPSLRGKLGWFADRRVSEGDGAGKGTSRFVKWRPYPDAAQ